MGPRRSVVLTAIELFAGFSLQDAWKEAGGRHVTFADAWRTETNNLRVVADVTQQLYLDLPPYARWLGAGVFEVRIDFGPGYRVYFGKDGDTVVILLGGGTKKRQSRDIETAQERWKDYKGRKT